MPCFGASLLLAGSAAGHTLVNAPAAFYYVQMIRNSVKEFLPIGKCKFIENETLHWNMQTDTFNLILSQ